MTTMCFNRRNPSSSLVRFPAVLGAAVGTTGEGPEALTATVEHAANVKRIPATRGTAA
jgi:hypothetical protein